MEAFIMCGAPGSGKSTFISRHLSRCLVLSGDNIREELYGDASIQGNWLEIKERMLRLLSENPGKDVVIDGTHCRAKYRRDSIEMLRSFGYDYIVAVVVKTPLGRCLEQNRRRGRQVPEEVIRSMHETLEESVKGIHNEEFNRIDYIF